MKKISKIEAFFHTSNLIEGVDDKQEDERNVVAYEAWLSWLDFHISLNHLNNYCFPWQIRAYPVFVWGRECLHHEEIDAALALYFGDLYPNENSTWKQIKDWHVSFEKVHPFGDWNGRVGRYLMLQQCEKAWCLREMYREFAHTDNKSFNEMREKYYNIF